MSETRIFPDPDAAAAACAAWVLTKLDSARAGRDQATVAFSGGSTPKLMFAHLAKAGYDWSRVEIFFVDERAVPPDDPASNYRMALEHLIRPARIPSKNVHRIPAELPPDQAVRRYEAEIRDTFRLDGQELPHFDVIHLGMGADAHTASLFPGDPNIDVREGIAAAVKPESVPQARVTLLPGVLLGARNLAVLTTGADKAEAVRRVFRESPAHIEAPIRLIAEESRRAVWFFDDAAASLL